MRYWLGLGVMVAGLVLLGAWSAMITAPQIESAVRIRAETAVAQTVHHMTVAVSGRDIDLSGLADTKREMAQVLVQLNQVAGQRVIRKKDANVLAMGVPYVFEVIKDGKLKITGFVPSDAIRADLAQVFGDQYGDTVDAQLDRLILASGGPKDFAGLVAKGLTALAPLARGRFRLEGDALIITGEAAGPAETEAVKAVLTSMTTPVVNGIKIMDDGAPSKYGLNYQRIGGTSLRGKLPRGLTVLGMQEALGVPKIKGTVKIATAGDAGNADYLTAWSGILDQLESLTSSVNGADRKVLAKLIPGADAAKVKAALETGGFVVQITEQPKPAAEGDKRDNADTGLKEIYQNGAWVTEPVAAPVVKPAAATVSAPIVKSEAATVTAPVVKPAAVAVAAPIVKPAAAIAAPVVKPAAVAIAAPVVKSAAAAIAAPVVKPAAVAVAAPVVKPAAAAIAAPVVKPSATADVEKLVPKSTVPVVDQSSCQAATDAIFSNVMIIFLPNSDELDLSAATVVADLAKVMAPCALAGLHAEIGGHTDTSGAADKNLTLSQLRADRVRATLIAAGVPAAALTAKGYGSARPISENETPEGRVRNRRTTITWSH